MDFLKLEDVGSEGLRALIDRAKFFVDARKRRESTPVLAGRSLALVFEKASTRTRVSFEIAMAELGGLCTSIDRNNSQLGRGETSADTARVLTGMVDGIVLRTFGHDILETFAREATVPVINALTDARHPCQVVTDLLTIEQEFDALEPLRIAWIGDGNNMAASWLAAAGLLGLELTLACPEGYDPPAFEVEAAEAAGARLLLTRDPKEASAGAHVVMTDAWASMGQEEEEAIRRKAFAAYQVNAELMSVAAENAIALHCLPAHRNEEISDEVMDGPQSRIFPQAHNRLPVAKAVLEHCLLGASRG